MQKLIPMWSKMNPWFDCASSHNRCSRLANLGVSCKLLVALRMNFDSSPKSYPTQSVFYPNKIGQILLSLIFFVTRMYWRVCRSMLCVPNNIVSLGLYAWFSFNNSRYTLCCFLKRNILLGSDLTETLPSIRYLNNTITL